jgi:hypothetical protein
LYIPFELAEQIRSIDVPKLKKRAHVPVHKIFAVSHRGLSVAVQMQNCPICLEQMKLPSRLDSCFHSFCFACIIEWAKQTVTCPLCKSAFGSLIHSFDSKGTQFERTYITKDILESVPVVTSDRSKSNRKAVYAKRLIPFLPPISSFRQQLNNSNNHFRSDYISNPSRCVSDLSAPSVAFPCTPSSELVRWVRRDLLVLICSEGMETREELNEEVQQELAMLLHLITRAFQEARSWTDLKQRLLAKLAPVLASLPQNVLRRFIDEIGHFLASPFAHSVDEYDVRVRYQERTIVLDPEESEFVVIEDDGEEKREVRNGRKIDQVIILDDDVEVIIVDDLDEKQPQTTKILLPSVVEIDPVEEMAVIVIEDDINMVG